MVETFARETRISESNFVKAISSIFNTEKFIIFIKKSLLEYMSGIFDIMFSVSSIGTDGCIVKLEDNRLNRFALAQFEKEFGNNKIGIEWVKSRGMFRRILSVLFQFLAVLFSSLRNGVKLEASRQDFKVMREALWGLYDSGGYYFHDDFLVDEKNIEAKDLLLFSRGVPQEEGRARGYKDAGRSLYMHFDIMKLRISLGKLFTRIIPKYMISSIAALLKELRSEHFSIYSGFYSSFCNHAIPYERVFSNFNVAAEMGHGYFSSSHIPEAIICNCYGAKHYLMHWSDNSLVVNRWVAAYLGCDKHFVWGPAHVQGVEGTPGTIAVSGYPFKKFIKDIIVRRERVLQDMGVKGKGKIISFYDENFSAGSEMTAGHYVSFWRMMLNVALQEKGHTILVKPKGTDYHKNLPESLLGEYLDIRNKIDKLENVYFIDTNKWTFIETIGVSDIAVTQGMTSSSTIALICGIEGLFLDEYGYGHIFSQLYKDKIVFDDHSKLLQKIGEMANLNISERSNIPEELLRQFDGYCDVRGIDTIRLTIAGKQLHLDKTAKKTGVIVQARMGSTRLPGKTMMPLWGKPVLKHVIDRLKKCVTIDEIVIATTINKEDDIIAENAVRWGVQVFRGSQSDVLSRYYFSANKAALDVVVRVTSDCPLIDPGVADRAVNIFMNSNFDYVSNTIRRTFPRGMDVEVFSYEALKTMQEKALNVHQREHVTPYIYENEDLFRIEQFESNSDNSRFRLTLDTKEDYSLLEKIFEINSDAENAGTNELVDLLMKNEDLSKMNSNIKQKSIFEK